MGRAPTRLRERALPELAMIGAGREPTRARKGRMYGSAVCGKRHKCLRGWRI